MSPRLCSHLALTRPVVVWVDREGKANMANGFQTIAFKCGSSPPGHGEPRKLVLLSQSSTMGGDRANHDKTGYPGSDSDSLAFSRLKL